MVYLEIKKKTCNHLNKENLLTIINSGRSGS